MNDPIDFSKRTRRAIYVFILLILVLVLIPRAYSIFAPNVNYSFFQTDFKKKVFNYKNIKYKRKKSFYKKRKNKFSVPKTKFDPNTYSLNDWMNLGMSEKQATLILKFGKYGFYSNEDLRKVFVISDEFFNIIKDSIFYPEKPIKTFKSSNDNYESKIVTIELNSAQEDDLLKIKGIGPFFAKNIIKKRDELGGFVKNEQLLEVWKFDGEKLNSINKYITISTQFIRKINLNFATVEDLKKHPYITWNVANSIIKIRNQIGGFQSVEDIKRSVLIDDNLFEKIKPYLNI